MRGTNEMKHAMLEYAVMHNDDAEAERLREELKRLTEEI